MKTEIEQWNTFSETLSRFSFPCVLVYPPGLFFVCSRSLPTWNEWLALALRANSGHLGPSF